MSENPGKPNAIETLTEAVTQLKQSFDRLHKDLLEQKLINQVREKREDLAEKSKQSTERKINQGKL